MKKLVNNVQLTGRLGNNPNLQVSAKGNPYVMLSLATNESYKSPEGEFRKETLWHDVVAWGKTAELMSRLLKKGTETVIKGRLRYNAYKDKKGNKQYRTRIQVDEFSAIS